VYWLLEGFGTRGVVFLLGGDRGRDDILFFQLVVAISGKLSEGRVPPLYLFLAVLVGAYASTALFLSPEFFLLGPLVPPHCPPYLNGTLECGPFLGSWGAWGLGPVVWPVKTEGFLAVILVVGPFPFLRSCFCATGGPGFRLRDLIR